MIAEEQLKLRLLATLVTLAVLMNVVAVTAAPVADEHTLTPRQFGWPPPGCTNSQDRLLLTELRLHYVAGWKEMFSNPPVDLK